jgi:uncharacterized protein (DUF433 family)
VLVGKPVVRGTRLSVELLADGWTQEEILDNYPNLTAEDIRACAACRLLTAPDGRGSKCCPAL